VSRRHPSQESNSRVTCFLLYSLGKLRPTALSLFEPPSRKATFPFSLFDSKRERLSGSGLLFFVFSPPSFIQVFPCPRSEIEQKCCFANPLQVILQPRGYFTRSVTAAAGKEHLLFFPPVALCRPPFPFQFHPKEYRVP